MIANRFVAVDFETANPKLSSICQVGLVTFADGHVVNSWGTLVDPEDYFDPQNISIHGITERAIAGSPKFPTLFETLRDRIKDHVVVSHTAFDRIAFAQVADKYGLPPTPNAWLDSARVVRRTWAEWSQKGYGLANVCAALGIIYDAHNAIEDARAAGLVLVKALSISRLSLEDWLKRVNQPIDPKRSDTARIAMDGHPDGPLAGEEIVFTGALTIPRRQAASLAAKVGCDVAPGVRKTTTILVVGDQDLHRLRGKDKSQKHRKAEEHIANGQSIRILAESDFIRLVELNA